LEWLDPMDLRNSEAILFIPMDFVPGGSHGTVGRSGATSQADEVEGWRVMGGGGMQTATRPQAKQTWMSLLSTSTTPLYRGGIPPFPHVGSRQSLCNISQSL
jgi:hypothetical protein